ncbi:MAG TPA: glycosyltransferase family 39 protein [Thermoanaerobaculia bacterium]|nr:glycosyltransferase family 39 protein [Thermoanaerobaculia bacterium]
MNPEPDPAPAATPRPEEGSRAGAATARARFAARPVWGTVIALALALAAFMHMLAWGESPLVRALWMASMLAAVLAHARRPRLGRLPAGALVGLLLVLLGAAWLRFDRLGEIPDDYHGDIASQGMEARTFLDGLERRIFRTSWSDIPAFEYWQLAQTMRLSGDDLTGTASNAAIHGVLSILGVFLLARELYDRRTGLLAAALLAISYTHIHFSRLFTTATPLSLMTFTFFFLARGLRRGYALDFVLSGIFLGLGSQTYYPARMMPVILIVLLPWILFWHPELRRRVGVAFLGMAFGFFAAFGPFLAFALQNLQAVVGRGQTVMVWSPTSTAHLAAVYGVDSLAEVLWHSTLRCLGTFTHVGDTSTHFELRAAMVDPVTALFLLVGVLLAVARIREPRSMLLLVWLFGTLLLGGVLALDPPFWPHLVVLLIPAAILAAVPMAKLLAVADRWGPRRGILAAAAMAVLIAAVGWRNWQLYLDHVRHNAAPAARIGRLVAAADPSYDVHIVRDPWSVEVREIAFMAKGRLVKDVLAETVIEPHGPPPIPALYIVTPNHADALDALVSRHPSAVVTPHYTREGGLMLTSVRVDGPARPRWPLRATASWRASSFREEPADVAARAIDRNPGTRWDSGQPQAGGEWYQVELPSVVTVTDLRLDTMGSANDFPRGLVVSLSMDGLVYATLPPVERTAPRLHVRVDPPAQARFVRLEQTGQDAAAWWSIHELELWTAESEGPVG